MPDVASQWNLNCCFLSLLPNRRTLFYDSFFLNFVLFLFFSSTPFLTFFSLSTDLSHIDLLFDFLLLNRQEVHPLQAADLLPVNIHFSLNLKSVPPHHHFELFIFQIFVFLSSRSKFIFSPKDLLLTHLFCDNDRTQ